MSIRNLDHLLNPRSIAVIGASTRAGSIGQRVLENVLEGGFKGTIFAVNPKRVEMDDEWWVATVADLPVAPDLAVVVTPAPTIPGIIAELGEKGTKLAVVISAGFHDPALRQAMLDAARPHMMRIVGPNCLGVMFPHAGVNATFGERNATPGGIALLSQSGALVTSMVDWAAEQGVGFSGVVSVGDQADIDLGDLIDLFAADPKTDAILMYIEGISDAAKFLSAARAAARTKPVIAIKAGRSAAAGKAAKSHTGALTGSFDVHAAAFRRAGIVQVDTLTELFDAAKVLARRQPFAGDRLAIITDGGGPAVLAADVLEQVGGRLATLSDATIAALDPALPQGWSRGNPVDVIGDAHAERFSAAIRAVAADPGVDAVMVMHCPTAVESGVDIARVVADEIVAPTFPHEKPVIACWLGTRNANAARPVFARTGTPMFDNLDDAVNGFGYLLAAHRARAQLLRTPPRRAVPEPDKSRVRAIIGGALREGRAMLSACEAKAVLAAYGVPVVTGTLARSVDAVATACADMAPPYAVKIVSPEITHKSDVGGVALNLPDASAATEAARVMAARIGSERPEASIIGFDVEPMVKMKDARELLVGLADDATFGSIIAFGAGGTTVEVVRDRALGLPPLDSILARDMIAQTRVSKLLAAYRDTPAADMDAIVAALESVSALAVDFPEIMELDINPLMAGPDGVLAVDARIGVADSHGRARLAIRPVPMEWAKGVTTRGGVDLRIRPVLPEDEAVLTDFFHHVSADDIRFRFLTALHEVGADRIAAMTQIDYRRTMNFLAFAGDGTLVATALLASDPDGQRAELAVSVREGWKGKGVSWTLVEHALRYAEAEGIRTVESLESSENHAALALEREMGFVATPCADSPTEMIVRKTLTPA